MNSVRPRFLNLFQIRLPASGVVSIIHRISGVFVFLSLPLSIYWLQLSMSGVEGYETVTGLLGHWSLRIPAALLLWLFLHHLLAGIRFLMLDLEWGGSRLVARRTAWLVLLAALVVTAGLLL